MASKKKAAKAAEAKSKSAVKSKSKPVAKKAKPAKGKKLKALNPAVVEKAQLLSSVVVYQGPLFRVLHDKLIEPDGTHNERDVIRHNGSVVILAIDNSKSK